MSAFRTLLASLVLAVVGGAVLTAATDHFQAFTSEGARKVRIREHMPRVPHATLQTQYGRDIRLADLRGKWLLVDFIYTRCITYCTAQGSEFALLQRKLAAPLQSGKLELLSISFDPSRDEPHQLADYLQRSGGHGGGWLAARPVGLRQLDQLKRVFGIIVIPDGLGGYVHNTGFALVNPQGRLVAILDTGDPDQVVRDILGHLRS
ncbi:MAG: SCO family protein [Nevskiaceae bacterium]|nr:MAG: SCO family protein [Nevskiaceae bacterium]TBR73200.1 MAG: SCO family protein [Nevskiaceae bacterium]